MLWISFIVIFSYLIFVVAKFGIPKSISDTFYMLDKKGWLFQVFMGTFAFTLIPYWIDKSSEMYECFPFLACSALAFVAFAPCFRMQLEGMVHHVSAVLACVCAVLWQALDASWAIPVCFLSILGLAAMFKGNKFFWIEVAVIGSTLINLWLK